MDMIDRLVGIVLTLEELAKTGTTVIIIGHQANLRCLLGYFLDYPLHQIPHIALPLHTVFKLHSSPLSTPFLSTPFPIHIHNNHTHKSHYLPSSSTFFPNQQPLKTNYFNNQNT